MKKSAIVSFLIPVFLFLPGSARALTQTAENKTVHPSPGPTAAVDAVSIVARSVNEFAFDLYKRLSSDDEGKNIFFSPFSISDALAMTYAGARGVTEQQMAKVLHFSLSQGKLHPAFSSLIERLGKNTPKKGATLRIANALWGQSGYPFLQSFKTLVDKYYGGGFHEVDFAGDPEKARGRINTWIEEKTEEKIRNLIARGDINELTRLVLTNAIYFKGAWTSRFKEENTRLMPFYVSPQKTTKVPMMFQERKFPYFENHKLQVLELPYAGGNLAMILLLPVEKNGLVELETHLSEKALNRWRARLRERKVKVYLPRFKLETKCYLGRSLARMGMPNAFTNKADFSGMTGHKELKISKVIHQAYVDVNEEGTEAAAATAVVIRLKAVRRLPSFKADHPFVFLIVHKKTGVILFMGALKDPK